MKPTSHYIPHTPFRRTAAILLIALAAAILPTTKAHAALLDMTCDGTVTSTFSPAIAETAQTTTTATAAAYTDCVSESQPMITSGSRSVTLVQDRSCEDLLDPGTINYTIHWNTGQSSTITASYTTTLVGVLYSIESTGTVTAGVFAGDNVDADFDGLSLTLTACTLGLATVPSMTTSGPFEITPL